MLALETTAPIADHRLVIKKSAAMFEAFSSNHDLSHQQLMQACSRDFRTSKSYWALTPKTHGKAKQQHIVLIRCQQSEIQRALVHRERSFFGGFAKGRMGVADACNVFTAGAKLHRHHALGNQLACHRANHVHT